MLLIPSFFRDDVAFCGVFDGTVGDDAAEYVVKNIVRHLCASEEFSDATNGIFSTEPSGGASTDAVAEKIRSAVRHAFIASDQSLINMCEEKKLHYASSTGVTAFLWRNLLTIAHVGDSKACIARLIGDEIHPEWLTVDHKPNMPNELKRIEQNGGSLAWLHGNKPYIRYENILSITSSSALTVNSILFSHKQGW
jgi:protein phosphatase